MYLPITMLATGIARIITRQMVHPTVKECRNSQQNLKSFTKVEKIFATCIQLVIQMPKQQAVASVHMHTSEGPWLILTFNQRI